MTPMVALAVEASALVAVVVWRRCAGDRAHRWAMRALGLTPPPVRSRLASWWYGEAPDREWVRARQAEPRARDGHP